MNICRAIKQIAATYPELRIIYPVHLNPNVQKPVYELLADLDNVYLIAPVSYVPFVKLLESAHIVLTDSGGVQEEAPSLGKTGAGNARSYRTSGSRRGRYRDSGRYRQR